jgi:hypothetical protein
VDGNTAARTTKEGLMAYTIKHCARCAEMTEHASRPPKKPHPPVPLEEWHCLRCGANNGS